MNKLDKLPVELINKILNYTNVVVYRHGRYMTRILSSDYRYQILNLISKHKVDIIDNVIITTVTLSNNDSYIVIKNIYDLNLKIYGMTCIIGKNIFTNKNTVISFCCNFTHKMSDKILVNVTVA